MIGLRLGLPVGMQYTGIASGPTFNFALNFSFPENSGYYPAFLF